MTGRPIYIAYSCGQGSKLTLSRGCAILATSLLQIIWHSRSIYRPGRIQKIIWQGSNLGESGACPHPKTYITLTPTAVKINWTNMATKTTSHSTLVGTRLDGTQPIYEQLMWEIKLYSHVAVITATCTGHNRHQLWPNSQILIKLNWEAECDYSTVAMFFLFLGKVYY